MPDTPPPAGSRPHTRESLADDLRRIGVADGDLLLVHASLSQLGYVVGGPVALVQALVDVLGEKGTLMVPTHTTNNSEPAGWRHPPVPETWWDTIREHTPGYHAKITPSHHMGALAETMRTWPGAKRSDHPQVSFAALGPGAEKLLHKHKLSPALGSGSPLALFAEAHGRVLLLGVGHDTNTTYHLAEYRLPKPPPTISFGAASLVEGHRQWVTWNDLELDASDFIQLGAAFELTGHVVVGTVGEAQARLMPAAAAVNFAHQWLIEHRS